MRMGLAGVAAAILLLAAIIVGLAVLAIYAAMFGPFLVALTTGVLLDGVSSAGGSAAGLGLIVGIGLVCLLFFPALILLIFVNVRWIFQAQTIMLEQLNAVNGLRRSWNLISGSFWRVLGVALLLFLFVLALTLTPSYAAQAAVTLILPGSFVAATAVNSVIAGLIQILVAPIRIAVLTVLYYDLRVRREGYDLDLRAQELAVPPAPASPGELHDSAVQI